MGEGIGPATLIMLAIGFVLVGIVGPIAIDQIILTSTGAGVTAWNPAVVTIFKTLLPILYIVGVAIKFIPRGKGALISMGVIIRMAVSPKTVIMLTIALLLIAILTPIGMTNIMTGNKTLWDTALWTLWTILLPICFIIGVAIKFIPRGK